MLIDDLRGIQRHHGYLPEAELHAYAERTGTPLYQINAVATFYPQFRRTPPPETEILVCTDLACHLRGAETLARRLEGEAAGSAGRVEVRRCSCLGRCDRPPAVLANGMVADAPDALRADVPVSPLAPVLTSRRVFDFDPYGPDTSRRYEVWTARGQRAPEAIIAALKESGLRGMGGAGFPAGAKWEIVRRAPGQPKYVVCNADESEPGTFKDREMLLHASHLVLEGMLIAAGVVGAEEAILFIRHEYAEGRAAFAAALEDARARGLLAEAPAVRIFESLGGYICGEETALLEALEGKRAEPRHKPPFPGTHGLWGRPTLINNVETFALATAILQRGAAWYRSQGVNGGVGPKLLALSGDVVRPGVYEVPLGLTIRAFLEEYGGGVANGRRLKAVLPGGASSGFLPPELADTPLEFGALAKLGSMLGSGAVIALAEGRCVLDAALNLVRFFRNESCGKCVPCRAGSEQLVGLLEAWRRGEGSPADADLIADLAPAMADASICGLGQVAPAPIVSALRYWPDEILAHVRDRCCPAGVCPVGR
ncbi:MAG: NAD(P)H-dependent oxidoreductase subunit E [Armatimonadetes bacterium]|nr:NAD(P)H-dependent oxidoreductase subunit E [Armatimonadota bacterium]